MHLRILLIVPYFLFSCHYFVHNWLGLQLVVMVVCCVHAQPVGPSSWVASLNSGKRIVELILFPFDFTILFSSRLLARRALNAFVVCLTSFARST